MDQNKSLVAESLENKSIFVTGSTGFLAKLFVEEVLRIQPKVKQLYLLVRASDTAHAKQRVQKEVLQMEVFENLRKKYGEIFDSFFWSKVYPVAGDVSLQNLGVKDENLIKLIWTEINIIVNVAATTNFNERYDAALSINTLGVYHILTFAARCTKLEMLLHVSTAYVAKESRGSILEKEYPMDQSTEWSSCLKFEDEVNLVEEKLMELKTNGSSEDAIKIFMKGLGKERANLFGWPNTYTFTKAMGEMVLADLRGDLPVVIVRPTIITSTYKEPFPGWIEGVKTLDLVIVGYGTGQLKCLAACPSTVLDLIPADMVVNAMLEVAAAHSRQSSMAIYHVGSSARNPVTLGNIRHIMVNYFSANPYKGRDGKPIKVGGIRFFPSLACFNIYTIIRYKLPLLGLGLLSALICSQNLQGRYDRLSRMFNQLLRLAEAYEPYTISNKRFDDGNLQKLREIMYDKDHESFGFNASCIDWEDYLMDIHIPGLLRYGMKESQKL